MESRLPLFASVVFAAAPAAAAAAAKSLQSCLTLCDPIDGNPPGSPVPGILQAKTLECVAISFCNAWKWKVKVKSLSRVRLFATPWTAAYQAPPSMGFSRQEYWMPLGCHCLLLLCLHLLSNEKKKSYCQDQGQGAFIFIFLMNFMISWYSYFVIIKFRLKEIEWLVQSYITNKVVETDHA